MDTRINSESWAKKPVNSGKNTNKPNKEIDLKQAMKDYMDEQLSGLTDEEREKIDKLSREYLKENPIKTKADADNYAAYVKSLLKQFGFKGNIDDMVSQQMATGKVNGSAQGPSAAESKSEIVTEADGEKYVLITLPSGQSVKIKVGADTVKGNEIKAKGNQNTNFTASLINDYENNTLVNE